MTPLKDKLAEVIWAKPPQSIKQMREAINEEWRDKAKLPRILLADDDKLSIELFKNMTEGWNYELITCFSVKETMAELTSKESFKAALLDAVLMNGSGIEIYKWVAENRPELNVAFITNYEVNAIQNEAEAFGPARVFNKARLGEAEFVEQLMLQVGIQRKFGTAPFGGPKPTAPESP